jgi:alkylhydroperoxidase family enzyme
MWRRFTVSPEVFRGRVRGKEKATATVLAVLTENTEDFLWLEFPDALFAQVKAKIGQSNLVDLTGAIAFWNMMARNLNALKVDREAW